jgi:hypothetical protein
MAGYLAGCLDSSRMSSESGWISEVFADYRRVFSPHALSFFICREFISYGNALSDSGEIESACISQRWFGAPSFPDSYTRLVKAL